MTGKQLWRMLVKNGFREKRTNGSHHTLRKGNITVTVPIHGNKELGVGLERKILKDAGLLDYVKRGDRL